MSPTIRDKVLQAIRDTAQEQGALKAILFGSFARNTATRHSDVDAVFVEETHLRFVERLDRYLNGIYRRLGIATDVLVYTPEEFKTMADKPFMKRILREGVVAYER
jgi:predicted nucleotidyltransferase